MLLRTPLCLASGAVLALAFPPFDLPVGDPLVLLLPALAVLLWAVRRRSALAGAALGAAHGIGFFLVHLFWLRVMGYDAWLALSVVQSLYLAAAGAALALVSRLRWWPLWSAVVWVGVEVVRGSWPLGGFTWGRLAFASVDTPLAGWLPWLGANGVSLLAALLAAVLLRVVLVARRRPRTAAATVAVAALAVAAPLPLGPPGEETGTVTVAVVQGDVPGAGNDLLSFNREVTESHVLLTEQLAEDVSAGEVPEPDLVVWPENTTAVDPFADAEIQAWLERASAAIDVPILVGAIVDAEDDDAVLNQGIVFEPGVGATDRYTKRHPVPFGEYVPFRDTIAALGLGELARLSMIPRDMMSGTRTSPIRVGDVLVADAICFDVAYDDAIADQVRGGAGLVTVQTSNALFIHTGQIEQQFTISRLRAIETGRAVAVAAVNGLSGVIGRDGTVLSAIEPRTRATTVVDVPLVAGTPPSMVVGPWLGRAAALVTALLLLARVVAYPRRRHEPATVSGEGEPA